MPSVRILWKYIFTDTYEMGQNDLYQTVKTLAFISK
jgi:hypothetical protein